jgi:UbiD family decarboxylase
LEIGNLSYLAAASFGSPALLFDKIKDHKPGYRILSTPYGTYKRIALSLGLSLEADGLGLVREMREKLKRPFEPVPPMEVKGGPILENVHKEDEVDLFEFPTPQWQPPDGGRYIGTGSTIITRVPDEGWVNFGCQRVQIHDKSTATIMFDQARHGAIIRNKYWARGQSCPVAVTCGGDPFHIFVASSRIPWGTSEYDYVGWWRREPVEVIRGRTTGLPIPACAEIVLEGEIVPPEVETRVEGPFSEWTGHYAPKRNEAVFRVKCILHRNDPILLGALPFFWVLGFYFGLES